MVFLESLKKWYLEQPKHLSLSGGKGFKKLSEARRDQA